MQQDNGGFFQQSDDYLWFSYVCLIYVCAQGERQQRCKRSESQQHFGVIEVEDSFDPKYVEGRKCRDTHTPRQTQSGPESAVTQFKTRTDDENLCITGATWKEVSVLMD